MKWLAAILPVLLTLLVSAPAGAQDIEDEPPPPALSTVLADYPAPPGLENYVTDQAALQKLGKALFWDMQVGSDGIVACASCHFRAGTDGRERSQANPGPNGIFDSPGPGRWITPDAYPLHRLSDPDDRFSLVRDSDDRIGSQGVFLTSFGGTGAEGGVEDGTPLTETTFVGPGGVTRQVTGRNAPSIINATFNFQNFWDGRARNIFNGQTPFGENDPGAVILMVDGSGQLVEVQPALDYSSLASQAVGPIGSGIEMAYVGRTLKDLGHKLLPLPPLAKQLVHFEDSLLDDLTNYPLRGLTPGMSYLDMVQAAFIPELTSHEGFIDGYTQAEFNFGFFWGLALQAYMGTLISDDSKYDRVQLGLAAFTPEEQRGLDLFLGEGLCIACHTGPEFTSATTRHMLFDEDPDIIIEDFPMLEGMQTRSLRLGVYDLGYYNVGVRPTAEDLGRGGQDPWGNPLSWTLTIGVELGLNPANAAVDGAFKTPSLRNVELTGPYFHNGGTATLMDTVDFYARGSDFFENNLENLSPEIGPDEGGLLSFLVGNEPDKRALVAFMLTLTDERVKEESAPFDHPQLFIPMGIPSPTGAIQCTPEEIFTGNCDNLEEIPAIGAFGRTDAGKEPIGPFLGLDPYQRSEVTYFPLAPAITQLLLLAPAQ